MSDENYGNDLTGAFVGISIGNRAHAEAAEIRANTKNRSLESRLNSANELIQTYETVLEKLKRQVTDLDGKDVSFNCTVAGVRGVTRELLEELRKSDPKNPLLDKKIRDRVFDSLFKSTSSKVHDTTYLERTSLAESWRNETYGAEGANKSGPEESKITPNIQVRADSEVPSHTPEREKLLGLVEKLSAELKKANPNAPILQDKAMLDVFTDYTINEMVRQEKSKPV